MNTLAQQDLVGTLQGLLAAIQHTPNAASLQSAVNDALQQLQHKN